MQSNLILKCLPSNFEKEFNRNKFLFETASGSIYIQIDFGESLNKLRHSKQTFTERICKAPEFVNIICFSFKFV